MEVRLLRLLVFLLCLSHLLSLIAVPVTGSRSLVDEYSQVDGVSASTQMGHGHVEKIMEEKGEDRVARKMEVEVNDYPGSGANNRHTSYPRLGRGCTDC